MKEKAPVNLPENWDEMIYAERRMWFVSEYGTNKIDNEGNLVYDTDRMPDEVLEAYKAVVEGHREMMKQGIMMD